MARSIRAALTEQGLDPLTARLREVLPDIADQYSANFNRAEYDRLWEGKMRGMHAFQVQCALDALEHVGGNDLVVADIGDSSGNHAAYLHALAPAGRLSRVVSVNLDPVAVDKVTAKGGQAVLCRAEELDKVGIRADLFMSFETLEHLIDPVGFLHALAEKGSAEYCLITVPYRRHSRFGGAHLRLAVDGKPAAMTPEAVHIHEYSPEDWTLLAQFAGFSPVFTRIYRQYPRRSPLAVTQGLWGRLDFEGFVALFLRRDLTLARRYTGW